MAKTNFQFEKRRRELEQKKKKEEKKQRKLEKGNVPAGETPAPSPDEETQGDSPDATTGQE